MERRNSKKWINDLEIAIINKNLKQLVELSERDVPSFASLEEAKQALHLVEQAKNIIKTEQAKIGNMLNQKKKLEIYNLDNKENSFYSWNS
jgi:hypothetical protein